MKPKQDTKIEADKLVRDIKRATRRKFSAKEKIRIVLASSRGPLATVFSPSGEELRAFGSSQQGFTLEAKGTYVVKVTTDNHFFPVTGTYDLSLQCDNPIQAWIAPFNSRIVKDGTLISYPLVGSFGKIIGFKFESLRNSRIFGSPLSQV